MSPCIARFLLSLHPCYFDVFHLLHLLTCSRLSTSMSYCVFLMYSTSLPHIFFMCPILMYSTSLPHIFFMCPILSFSYALQCLLMPYLLMPYLPCLLMSSMSSHALPCLPISHIFHVFLSSMSSHVFLSSMSSHAFHVFLSSMLFHVFLSSMSSHLPCLLMLFSCLSYLPISHALSSHALPCLLMCPDPCFFLACMSSCAFSRASYPLMCYFHVLHVPNLPMRFISSHVLHILSCATSMFFCCKVDSILAPHFMCLIPLLQALCF